MLTITQTPHSITICGHANIAPAGYDIICASVSVLFQNLVVSLEELTEDTIEYKFTKGDSYLKFGTLSERGQLLLSSFFIGADAIANTCPDHVKVVK